MRKPVAGLKGRARPELGLDKSVGVLVEHLADRHLVRALLGRP